MKYLLITFLLFLSFKSHGQMAVNDPFEDLIPAKTRYNASIGVAERWKFQTFSGTLDATKNAYIDFRKSNRDTDATIVFAQPHYKVWAANTRTRAECEYILETIKKTYSSVFVIKPKL
jgi:hypothetical protein